MSLIGYVHHSGRYDRAAATLAASVCEQAALPDVSLIGLTEVANPVRSAKLFHELWQRRWGYAHNDHGECGLAYDQRRHHLVAVEDHVLTRRKTWTKRGKLRPPFTATLVVLEDLDAGKRRLYAILHTPSAVQAGNHWRHNHRAAQHKAGLRALPKLLRQARAKHHVGGGTVVSMDLNLSVSRAWVRAYLRSSLPGYRLVYDTRPVPTHGGGRAIDVVLVGRRLNPRRWFQRKYIRVVTARDSDHRSVIVKLADR